MQPYPTYKHSDIEWLGQIPAEWEVIPLKFATTQTPGAIKTGPFGSQLLSSEMRGKDVKIYNQRNVIDCNLTQGENYITYEKYEELRAFTIYPGDVLVTTRGTIGRCVLVPDSAELGILHPCLMRIQTNSDKLLASYLILLIQDSFLVQTQLFQMSNATTIEVIYSGTMRQVLIPIPPLPEQRAIADFLDHKTRLIDTYIAKKQQQIERWQAYRAALINQAVTKGLNPDAPMKDSSIEWLGEIPVSWEVVRLRRISEIKYGLGQPPKELEGGLPLIRATNIKRGKVLSEGLLYVDPHDIPYDRDPILKEDDIIVVRSGAYTGDSAIIPKEFEGAITGYDMVIRTEEAVPKFIAYGLLSHYILQNQIDLCRLRAAQPHLNAEELGNILILLPPKNEQQEIVAFMETQTAKIDTLIAATQHQIERLQAYRAALISDAVTGKIDVRTYRGSP